jgi:aryl-alcohol dehydrogenase-like predicted oxidoreductase
VRRSRLGATDLEVSALCLGTNVFGWTADEAASFAVLDAFVDAGGTFVDTADSYNVFAEGLHGGESETIIGRWLARGGRRDAIVLATKVGKQPGFLGLAPANVRAALEGSLRRLGTDHVDLYYAHVDDETVPLEETLGVFDALVREGKVRHVAASNHGSERLAEALAVAEREGLRPYVALQTHYNLVDREAYEGPLEEVCAAHGVACVPHWALASGFLTGKYRPGAAAPDTPRREDAEPYLDGRGVAVLEALDAVAGAHGVSQAAVALAWLRTRPTVIAPVASARSVEQLEALLDMARLDLRDEDVRRLDGASAPWMV